MFWKKKFSERESNALPLQTDGAHSSSLQRQHTQDSHSNVTSTRGLDRTRMLSLNTTTQLNEMASGGTSMTDAGGGHSMRSNLAAGCSTSASGPALRPASLPSSSEKDLVSLSSRCLPQHLSQEPSTSHDERHIYNANFHEGGFSNAQNVVINNAYMIDNSRSEYVGHTSEPQRNLTEKQSHTEEERKAEKALEKLAEKGMPGAMLDSKERAYAPRCNEDTRRTVRARIVKWVQDGGEIRHLLWLSGSAAVGKSAVAQSVAEELKREGFLGAVFFFSRPNNRSDPDAVIPTLIYQFALLLPEYKHMVVQKLIQNPLLLDQNRLSLFRSLVTDPFRILASQHQPSAQRPLVIILDGLDECLDRQAQCEFVEMISQYARTEADSCLRWMICSRPEPDIKVAFSTEDCKAVCLQEKLEVDDIEARADARRILTGGFADIRLRYPDQLPGDWPDEKHVRFIADRASGHLGFASFIIRFIGDKEYDDPSGQLNVCLRFLERIYHSTDQNPLHALDLIYAHIFSTVPNNILPVTRRILGVYLFSDYKLRSAVLLANFLGLDQTSFYRALRCLHSVLLVPPFSEAGRRNIQIYHASFSDYLKDPTRSGNFVLDEGAIHLDVALRGLKWMSYCRKDPSDRLVSSELTWVPLSTSGQSIVETLISFSFLPCWKACPLVPKDSLGTLFKKLDKFDFDLEYSRLWPSETRVFAYFIQWLASLGHRQSNFNFCKDELLPQTRRLLPTLFLFKGFAKRSPVGTTSWQGEGNVSPLNQNYRPFPVMITICHREDDYSTFMAPFRDQWPEHQTGLMSFTLGKFNPIRFKLIVSSTAKPWFYSLGDGRRMEL